MKPCFLADSRFYDAIPVATSESDGFSVRNIMDSRPFTLWKATGNATQEITVTCPAAKAADTLGIAGHNLQGASVTLFYSTDGGTTWQTALGPFVPENNLALLNGFTQATADHWKLQISGASDAPYIGVLAAGLRLEAQRSTGGIFTPQTISAVQTASTSKTGQPLGTLVKYFGRSIKVNLPYQGQTFADALEDFYLANAGKPFFYGWDLDNWPKKSGLVIFTSGVSPSYDSLSRPVNIPLELQGVLA